MSPDDAILYALKFALRFRVDDTALPLSVGNFSNDLLCSCLLHPLVEAANGGRPVLIDVKRCSWRKLSALMLDAQQWGWLTLKDVRALVAVCTLLLVRCSCVWGLWF